MKLILNLSSTGTITVKNSDSTVQYVARLDLESYSGTIFDELEVSELLSMKKTDEGFTVTAFDTPLGVFKPIEGESFGYECEAESLKITQSNASFSLVSGDGEMGVVTPHKEGFSLDLNDDANVLIAIAEVLVIVAAKSAADKAAKPSKKVATDEEKTAAIETKEEIAAESESETNVEELPADAVKWGIWSYVKPIITSVFRLPQKGRTPLDGSLAMLFLTIISAVSIIVTSTLISNKVAFSKELKFADATVASGSDKGEIKLDGKTYEFPLESKKKTATESSSSSDSSKNVASQFVSKDSSEPREVITVYYKMNDKGEWTYFSTEIISVKAEKVIRTVSIVILCFAAVLFALTSFGMIILPKFLLFSLKGLIVFVVKLIKNLKKSKA